MNTTVLKSTTVRRAVGSAAGLALLVALGACGAIEDKISEAVTERVIGEAVGGDVDIDTDDETLTISSDDGTMTIGTELPDEWPSSLPLPSDHTVAQAIVIDEGEGPVLTVALMVDGEFEDVRDEMAAALDRSPWNQDGEEINASIGDMESSINTYLTDGMEAFVTVQSMGGDVSVMYRVELEHAG